MLVLAAFGGLFLFGPLSAVLELIDLIRMPETATGTTLILVVSMGLVVVPISVSDKPLLLANAAQLRPVI